MFFEGSQVCQSHTMWVKAQELGPRSNQICFLYGKYSSGGDQLVCKTMLDTGGNKTNIRYYIIGIVAL